MAQAIPKLLFVGAGNIAQSIIKGVIRARPNAASSILVTAPTRRNLNVIDKELGCRTTLLDKAQECIIEFKPDYVFLCFKPQVLINSIENSTKDILYNFLKKMPQECTTLSLLAGVQRYDLTSTFNMESKSVVRVMLNTAAEIGSTSVFYNPSSEFNSLKAQELEELFKLIGKVVVRLNDESLMDVATGICGSGIAFFYEMIQTISDIGVKNGLSRGDATLVAAQLSKSAGEMLLEKQLHPYKLRDDVTSPAGTTIYGISSWHEQSTGQSIGKAFQASIDRAKSLTQGTKTRLNPINRD